MQAIPAPVLTGARIGGQDVVVAFVGLTTGSASKHTNACFGVEVQRQNAGSNAVLEESLKPLALSQLSGQNGGQFTLNARRSIPALTWIEPGDGTCPIQRCSVPILGVNLMASQREPSPSGAMGLSIAKIGAVVVALLLCALMLTWAYLLGSLILKATGLL